jgi:hypothetical protein
MAVKIFHSSQKLQDILTVALFSFSVDQSVMNLHQRGQYLIININWNPCEHQHVGQPGPNLQLNSLTHIHSTGSVH